MPFTGEAKNEALNALLKGTSPTLYCRYIGAMKATAAVKAEASTAGTEIKKTAHGLSNGEVIVFTVLEGGAGLVALRPYYIVEKSTNAFKVSLSEGGTAVTFTTEVKTGTEYQHLTEMSGGSYKRIATKFGSASLGAAEDSEAHEIKIPASNEVEYLGYWSAETTGTLMGVDKVTKESFTGEGTYKVTSSKADMDLAEGTPAP